MTAPQTGARARARAAALAVAPPLRRLVTDRDNLREQRHELRRQLQAIQVRADALAKSNESLLKRAICQQVAEPGLQADLRYLFIVAYGRSGSTLLQGILCSIPGYEIRGENSAALYRLYEYHQHLVKAKERIRDGRVLTARSPWFGIEQYATESALAGMRTLVTQTLLRPAPDTRVTGFKEIRWWYKDWPGYLAFLQHLFPGARFVLNVRNHDAVVKSKWWAANEESATKLAQYEKQMDKMAGFLGDAAYRINFDDYLADPNVLAGLFEWLGEPFDRATVDEVMAVRHSS
jgi:hypothetical protein